MNRFFALIGTLFVVASLQAQMSIGLLAGVNMSNEVTSFDNSLDSKVGTDLSSLKGVVIGPTIEMMMKDYNMGIELGSYFSRKGSNFSYTLDNPTASTPYAVYLEGYKSVDYLEVPLTFKWKFGAPNFKVFISAGYFWGFALSGTIGVETAVDLMNGSVPLPDLVKTTSMDFGDEASTSSYNSFDGGYTVGAGMEIIKTLQISVHYNYSAKSLTKESSIKDLLPEETYGYTNGDFGISSKNSVVSVRLTYLLNGH